MAHFGNDTFVIPNVSVVTAPMGDGIALIDFESNVYFSLNATGALVWRVLSAPDQSSRTSVVEIVNHVATEYGIAEDACASDITELVADLEKNGLVSLESATS